LCLYFTHHFSMRASGTHQLNGIRKRSRQSSRARPYYVPSSGSSEEEESMPSGSEESTSFEPSEDCDVCYIDGSSGPPSPRSEDAFSFSQPRVSSLPLVGTPPSEGPSTGNPPEHDVHVRGPPPPSGAVRFAGGANPPSC